MVDPFDDIPQADPQALARLHRWGGDKLPRDMAALFRTEVPARLRAAREATSQGNCDGAERAAHSLKSTCAQLGAVRMRALADKVEILSAQGHLDPLSALLDRLEQEFVSFTHWLDRNDYEEVKP
jgi:histidine phosphotransfer protein HptB